MNGALAGGLCGAAGMSFLILKASSVPANPAHPEMLAAAILCAALIFAVSIGALVGMLVEWIGKK